MSSSDSDTIKKSVLPDYKRRGSSRKACFNTAKLLISDRAKYDVSTFLVYKDFNGQLGSKTSSKLDSFEMSIDHNKIVASDFILKDGLKSYIFNLEGSVGWESKDK